VNGLVTEGVVHSPISLGVRPQRLVTWAAAGNYRGVDRCRCDTRDGPQPVETGRCRILSLTHSEGRGVARDRGSLMTEDDIGFRTGHGGATPRRARPTRTRRAAWC